MRLLEYLFDSYLDAVERDILNLKPNPVRDNLTTRERNACKLLSRRSDIVIKSADKGSTIKFTCNHSFTSIPFLDVNVSLNNGKITTGLYTKPTDKHQYLLHSSCHPKHTKQAIPFSLALRLRRVCSSNETFTLRANELKSCLNKRGYNLSFLNQEIKRIHITRTEAITPKDTSEINQPKQVPLVITHNPALRSISSLFTST